MLFRNKSYIFRKKILYRNSAVQCPSKNSQIIYFFVFNTKNKKKLKLNLNELVILHEIKILF